MIKHARNVLKALEVFEAMDPLHQTLMRASTGQRGTDSEHCSTITVRDVARMDCLGSIDHVEISEGVIFCASMLHQLGLPYDYVKLEDFTLLESCPCCSAPLWDPSRHPTRLERIFTWQCHAGRCGGKDADFKPMKYSRWL